MKLLDQIEKNSPDLVDRIIIQTKYHGNNFLFGIGPPNLLKLLI